MKHAKYLKPTEIERLAVLQQNAIEAAKERRRIFDRCRKRAKAQEAMESQ